MIDPNRSDTLGGWRRRRILATLGTTTAVGVAGCFGEESPDDRGDADRDDQDASNGADAPDRSDDDDRIYEHDGEDPIEYDDDRRCAVCAMHPSEYPGWNGQLAHENDEGAVFCTPGCLFAYYASPEHFAGPDEPVVAAWTTDFETEETIDATAATFALENDPEETEDDPMRINPRPFADSDDALTYVEERGHLDDDDLAPLDDVDEEVAAIYREERLPRS